jgi:hypothetical protein
MNKELVIGGHPTSVIGTYTEVQRRFYSLRRVSLLLLSITVGLAPIPNNVLSPRSFNDRSLLSGISGQDDPLLFFIRSTFGAAALAWSIVALVSVKRHRFNNANLILWLSAAAFGFSLMISGVLGTHPRFSPYMLILPVAFSALMLLDVSDEGWFINVARRICLLQIYGGLLAAVVLPSVALEVPYRQGWLLPFRLHGLGTHANNLAPLTVLFIGFDLLNARSVTPLRVMHWTAAFAVFVLAQSKTVWAAAVLALMIVSWLRLQIRLRIVFGAVLGVIVALAVFCLIVLVPFEPTASNPYVWQVTTLTGRTAVWAYTVDAWRTNPIFGYGPELWSGELRLNFARLHGWAPGQAHNQFFQTLGQAGLVGVTTLGLYIVTLISHAWRYVGFQFGAISFVIIVMLLRSLTEFALQGVIFNENFAFQFFVFGMLVLLNRRKARG